MRTASWLAACALSMEISNAAPQTPNRVSEIRSRGTLHCGIWPEVPGFAIERDGQYIGFDVDICRAVAAAILGDATKVDFYPLQHVAQFAERKDIDLAIRRLTWTPSREVAGGMVFGPITFYDGQGFLVPRNSGITSISQLARERICVLNVEHHPKTLYEFSRENDLKIRIILVESDRDAEEALLSNRCRAYSADISWLAAARSGYFEGVTRYRILPDQISKEPLAPLMRANDPELAQMVRWTIFAMIAAEELHLTSHNIDQIRASSLTVRTFLNIHPDPDGTLATGYWVRAVIAGVGNYGEVYDRNLGANSPIKLDRGPNRLWSRGGLMYAPPLDR